MFILEKKKGLESMMKVSILKKKLKKVEQYKTKTMVAMCGPGWVLEQWGESLHR